MLTPGVVYFARMLHNSRLMSNPELKLLLFVLFHSKVTAMNNLPLYRYEN